MKIILVGFMGSGKTTVSKELANKLNFIFIDIDDEIEKKENKTISNIFEEYGESYFRKIESEVLNKVLQKDNVIISTGGGIIKKLENIEKLKKEKNVIFLDANAKKIQSNIIDEIQKRPILKNSKNVYETIQNLLQDRYDKYDIVSNIKININDKNINQVVSEILVYIR